MKRNKYYSIWLAGLALLADSRLFACSCGEISPQDAFAGAREVFAGTVIQIARFEPVIPVATGTGATEQSDVQIIPISLNEVTFQVAETWKGSNTIIKVVLTGQGNGDCGVPFALGSDYLVYARDNGFSADTAFVHACGGTSLHFLAGTDLEFLGPGQKPIHPVLNILREQSSVTLSWRTNWTNFRVEAASFQPPVVWQPVSNYVGILGGNYVVTNEMASPGSFFRLAR